MFKFIIPILTAISLCLLIIMLNITTPTSAGPFGILMVFFFLYISSFGLMTIFLFIMSKVAQYIINALNDRSRFKSLKLKQSAFYSSIIATAPVILLALRSVGVVSWHSYILVVVFVSMGCLYIARRIM